MNEIWNRGLPQLYHYAISKCLKFLNVSVHKTDQKTNRLARDRKGVLRIIYPAMICLGVTT